MRFTVRAAFLIVYVNTCSATVFNLNWRYFFFFFSDMHYRSAWYGLFIYKFKKYLTQLEYDAFEQYRNENKVIKYLFTHVFIFFYFN